ncbi:MAG: zinc-regulated TonB-dependent outer membrane receptor [Myxococcaceae bacterium]|nr:zinc-regulated TonB-dependent outer membrane receptor [Myxococcaceae bacterium]
MHRVSPAPDAAATADRPPSLSAASPPTEDEAAAAEANAPDVAPVDGSDPSAPSPPNVSEEELRALQEAMAADAAAQREAGATSSGSQTTSTPPSGFALQSLNPDLAFIADVAAAYFTREPTLETGEHDPHETGFTLQQLELAVGKSVDPYFRFDANIVFRTEDVEVEEAYATTLALPHRLQLRLGQFLTRFGRINSTHPHQWAFVDQPLAIGRIFGPEGSRGVGVEASWLMPLPWYVELVASATDARGEETARSFFGGDEAAKVRTPLDVQYTGALKQFFAVSDDWSLLWGLSIANGPNPSGYRARTDVYGTDLYLKYRPITDPANPTIVSLQAEVFYRRRQIPGDVLQDLDGYAELFWRFEPRWGVAARYELGSPVWGLHGHVVVDPLDPEWTAVRHRISTNVTFWPTEFSRIRLQGGVDEPRWEREPDWSLMLAFEFAIGAHGAHAF